MSHKDKISEPNKAWESMEQLWTLIDDLYGGTISMRDARAKWLPVEERESAKAYNARLDRSILYNSYRDTIKKIVSKPFSQPVIVQGEGTGHEALEAIEDNADRRGSDLTAFGREVFEAAVKYGMTHVLVDHPSNSNLSLAQQRERDIRPYFVHVPPTNLIAWRFKDERSEELSQARIKETVCVPDGEWGEKEIERITVWFEDRVEVWENESGNDDDGWVVAEGRDHTFGRIPLLTFYIDRTGTLTSTPPLEDLAWLNLAHWQSYSDQRNILRVARVPIILATGFKDGELDGMTIGPSRFMESLNPDAKLQHIEHSGKALSAGAEDIVALEERMVVLGLQPMTQKAGNTTATGKAIDEGRTHTAIQAWIRGAENFIEALYGLAGEWIGAEIPDDFGIDINNDFGFTNRSADEVSNLIKARVTGELSRETFLKELKRRGFLSEAVDIPKEEGMLEDEVPEPDVLVERSPEPPTQQPTGTEPR